MPADQIQNSKQVDKAHEAVHGGADIAGSAARAAGDKMRSEGISNSSPGYVWKKPAETQACVKDPDGYIVCGPIVGTPRPNDPRPELPPIPKPSKPLPELPPSKPMPELPPSDKFPFDPKLVQPDESKRLTPPEMKELKN